MKNEDTKWHKGKVDNIRHFCVTWTLAKGLSGGQSSSSERFVGSRFKISINAPPGSWHYPWKCPKRLRMLCQMCDLVWQYAQTWKPDHEDLTSCERKLRKIPMSWKWKVCKCESPFWILARRGDGIFFNVVYGKHKQKLIQSARSSKSELIVIYITL